MKYYVALLMSLFFLVPAYDGRTISMEESDKVQPRMRADEVFKMLGSPCDSRVVEGGDRRYFYKVNDRGVPGLLFFDIDPKSNVLTLKTYTIQTMSGYVPGAENGCK